MKKAHLQIHLAVFLAGFTGILGNLISLNGLLLIFYRLLICLVLFLIYLYFFPFKTKVEKHTLYKLVFLGSILSLHWISFYQCIKLTNVSVAVISLASSSCFTACLSPIYEKTRFNFVEFLLGLLGLSGIYLIFFNEDLFQYGILFGIGSSFLFSILNHFNKKISEKCPTLQVFFYQCLFALITTILCLLVWILTLPIIHWNFFLPSPMDWFWIILLCLFCTLLLQFLYLNSLKHFSPFTSNLIFNLEIVYTLIFAFILFKEYERLDIHFILGALLILISLATHNIRLSRNHKN